MGNARRGGRASATACALAILIVGCSTSVDVSEIVESQLREKESARLSPEIRVGTWRGIFIPPEGKIVGMTFTVTASAPLTGSIVFNNPSVGEDPCKVSAREQSRTSSTVTVATLATSGPANCADSGRWELGVDSSTLTGELVWSSSDNLVGSHMELKRRS
jgi:hypothetical protein